MDIVKAQWKGNLKEWSQLVKNCATLIILLAKQFTMMEKKDFV